MLSRHQMARIGAISDYESFTVEDGGKLLAVFA
jgi:hypothetical protein